MADRVIMPTALDSNGDIASGAKAYFYQTGTTTPLTVYSDEAGTTPHTQPLVADSAGVFAPVFTTTTPLKVNITDASDVDLPGFPSDPFYVSPSGGSSAANVTFSPISGNSATDVQAAIQTLTSLWNAVTTYGKSLINDADASAARTTLGLGSAATADLPNSSDLSTDGEEAARRDNVKSYVDTEIAGITNPVKAWVVFNGTGTPGVLAGDNVASITDNGTGDYTITFTNALANTNYAVVATVLNSGTAERNTSYLNKATGSFDINVRAASTALVDPDEISVTVLGA